MRILGITGGIATGKSTVTAMLTKMGAPALSADAVARELLSPGTDMTRAVLAVFPGCRQAERPDDLDRRALSRLIFEDDNARRRLEALMHPPIISALQAFADRWSSPPGGCAALEIPLLFETGLETLVDQIVVARCLPETQLARLQTRLGIGLREAQTQLAAQWPLEEKVRRAHTVIETNGSLKETHQQVLALWEKCPL